MVTGTNYREAIHFAQNTLEKQLDSKLVYHSLNHTQNDVVYSVLRMCELANLSSEKRNLAIVAAWYHDIGYIQKREGHEVVGAAFVKKTLPQFGFNSKQISQISSMILATKIPQTPKNLLSKILADADLDNLGRHDFFEISIKLHQELTNYGETITMEEWWKNQLDFLKTHTYFTSEAKKLRNQKKKENIRQLEKIIADKNYHFFE